jgi:hypothetical protein
MAERSLSDRFWQKVQKTDGCWLWTASTVNGYGQIGVFSRGHDPMLAHRVAWELSTGETLTDDITILHACDVRACVRNDDEGVYDVGGALLPRRGHLVKGTIPDNNLDMMLKGRASHASNPTQTRARGERHGHARLTEHEVRALLHLATMGARLDDLAALFPQVSPGHLREIIRGNAWTHHLR